jgi:hypothetical protein
MRTNNGMLNKPPVRWLLRNRLLVLGASVLVACENQPTTPMVNDQTGESTESIMDFELTPEGARDAQAAQVGGLHRLATVSSRMSPEAAFSASVGRVDNSPFDLTYFGGRVVKSATSYNVYVNCPEGPAVCWGTGSLTPAHFLRDLNRSDYINIVREYIGSDAKGKFPVEGMRTRATFTSPTRATLQEIFHIVSDAVTRAGASGYGAIYHVFLPKGTEMCITAGNCYSPSDPASWTFCAFHGSVNFAPARHVLFTVEPYQAVPGCQIPGQTPHGVIDATASTLAHELFETITDPDLDGWSNGLFGFEISDMCSFFGSNQVLNGNQYFIQSEYSNKLHLCTNQAPGV